MRSHRLLEILLKLQASRKLSARTLARDLEVSERTIYRDVEALCAAGVPLYAERGAGGGIVLAEGYRKALTQFDDAELRALFISAEQTLADLGLGDARRSAFTKLSGALSAADRGAVDRARNRVHLDQRRWHQEPAAPVHLLALRHAVWEDRRILLRYRDRARSESERTVDPLALVSKAGVWYLVARAGDEFRTFRVERVSAVELRERFERPADFDLERYWRESLARWADAAPGCWATLRVSAHDLDAIGAYWSLEIAERNESAGTVVVRVGFPSLDAAAFQVIAWGNNAEILDPAELRATVVARARDALVRYQR